MIIIIIIIIIVVLFYLGGVASAAESCVDTSWLGVPEEESEKGCTSCRWVCEFSGSSGNFSRINLRHCCFSVAITSSRRLQSGSDAWKTA